MMGHSGNEKQMFASITVNVWIPKDANIVGTQFKLEDILEDEPDKMERFTFFVCI
jgi:hypothetical protein